MNIEQLIEIFLSNHIYENETNIENFMNTLDSNDRLAMVSAMYIGRDHIHDDELTRNISRFDNDHIPVDHYVRILCDKSTSLPTYFNSFLKCARNSGFDFNSF